MTPSPHYILLIDHNPDTRDLVTLTLRKKFPAAKIVQHDGVEATLAAVRAQQADVIILHRTVEEIAVAMVSMIREINPTVPVIVMSGIDRSEEVLAAGATGFLNFAELSLLGNVVVNSLLPLQPLPMPSDRRL